MPINRLTISVLLFMVVTFYSGLVPGAKAESPDGIDADRMIRIQSLLFSDNFNEADSIAVQMVDDNPEEPSGYLFQAAVMIGQMVDREESADKERFFAVLDTVYRLSDQIIETGVSKSAAWASLWRGHAFVYRAIWESRFGAFTTAISMGLKARREYEKGLSFDSTLYDLYFGLGNYHYWKSAKAGLLKWIGIFKNEKDKGIEELRLAVDSSLISKESARNAFIWLFLNEEQFDSAIVTCGDLSNGRQVGKSILWPLAEAYFKNRKYKSALETYQLLREKIAEEPGNYFNLVECDYHLYRCYEKMNHPEKAKEIAERMVSYYEFIPKATRSRQRTNITFLRRAARI